MPACVHCEQRPAVTPFGLCAHCDHFHRVRRLYLPRAGRDPDDPKDRHRRRVETVLRRRANLRLPLFAPAGP